MSLSAYLCGGMELLLLVPYVLAQVLGGVAGAGLTRVRKTVAAQFVQEKEIIDKKKRVIVKILTYIQYCDSDYYLIIWTLTQFVLLSGSVPP